MRHSLNRRKMLARLGGAAITSLGWDGIQVPGSARAGSPNDKLNLAVIGCGGQGAENLKQISGENIVALCDVDDELAAEAFGKFPKAKRFRDYRKLLDAMHGQIDAVVVSIPDHVHAPVSLAAMELSKHVYCEKPLTWSIDEARRMARVAREKKLATQMGTQGMASDGSRGWNRDYPVGRLGEITELHVWTDRPAGWWPQGVDRPTDRPAVRSGLDWKLWLGVAPSAALSSGVLPLCLERMERLWHRRRGRHGHPQRGHALCRAGPWPAVRRRDYRDLGTETRDLPCLVAGEA